MATIRQISIPDVHVVQVDSRVDHLAGVEAELAVRGLRMGRQDEEHHPPRVRMGTRVVVVTDVLDPRCIRALRMARRIGAQTMLMMDGLVEWRNTYTNPRVGEAFLRPAPVDLICCSGLVDSRTLSTFGNVAAPTGLPRIDSESDARFSSPRGGPILVATANTPAFTEDERQRLLAALANLRQASRWTRTRLIWRLTDGLADELGVKNHTGSLYEAIDDCAGVIATPSTLHIEAMRAGRPTAVLHTNTTPLWQPSAWVWQPIESDGPCEDGGVEALTRGLSRWVDSPERLLRQLLRPTQEQLERQSECLRLLDASSGGVSASELVAESIAGLVKTNTKPKKKASLRPIARLPSRKPKCQGRRRIVSIVPFDHSPIGGVTTWSKRLSDTFERRADLGFDLHTLLVSTQPTMSLRAKPLLGSRTSLCVLDPMDDHFVTLANLRHAVESLDPDLVLPNYTDMAYAVATQLRYTGIPCVAIAHTDHAYYRDLMAAYPDWDAAVSVSSSINSWLAPIAGSRPTDTIVYGVPSSAQPRPVGKNGPIRIAYVGRIEQIQKRIMDLVPLTSTLGAMGVDAELHIVGEGPNQNELRKELSSTGSVKVIFHGGQSPEWVESFWPKMDIAVLVSEYEGTSITMLEAMGQGVVPTVTRVESGVGDWIQEGVTGMSAPVGEPEQIAHSIVELANDRIKLEAIGRQAWDKVSSNLSLDLMAERYAALFDVTLTRDVEVKPSLAGVTIGDRHNWYKQRTEDGTGEIAWLKARLTEAGYTSIAVRTPERTSDAVIIPAGDNGPDEQVVQTWQQNGVEIAWSSLMPGGVEWGFMARHLRVMVDKGCKRIAVYGLGQHTQRHAEAIESQEFPVIGFIDDKPPASGQALGLPATTPTSAMRVLKPDGVLLSSDAWEEDLWKKTRHLRDEGVYVHSIYGCYEEVADPEPVAH